MSVMVKFTGICMILISGFLASVRGKNINHWETVIYNNEIWKYFIGSSEPDAAWRSLSFDDASWLQGNGGIGYGDGDDNTIIPVCTSVYLRIKFNVADTGAISSALLNMDYDDAFVAYLNDVEVARVGISDVHPSHDQLGNDHEATMYRGGLPESFMIDKNKLKLCLLQGENVLAIQVHNSSETSSDMSSNAWLSFGINDGSHNYGSLPSWFIPVVEFNSSNLPIVVINTSPGETIMDEPKITADMKIIYHGATSMNYVSDSGNVYTGKIGIEIRGRYSASLPQKPYGFETRDSAGNNRNVSLLGMPPENDWTLIANYNDKTFLRNYLAFDIFTEMGHYATRSRYCEVVVNNEYQGIYTLTEKIKIDKNRVNIAKLTPDDNSGNNLTGGYMFKNDYFTSDDSWHSNYSPVEKPGADVYYVYYDPKPTELTQNQKEYIKDYVNSFEATLYSSDFTDRQTGYRAYLDMSSFIDYFIIGEVTRNVDTYKKSRYFYKDRDSRSGLIHSGPPWDFDWAWKNITENCINFNQTDGSGWAYKINQCDAWPVPPVWEVRLLQDKNFMNDIHDRYFLLRKKTISQTHLNHIIDSVAVLLDEAQKRHYQKWQILGINVGTPEWGDQPLTYSGEILKFKNWINTRLTWLDANMIGNSNAYRDGYKAICRLFPNPANEFLNIESDTIISKIVVYNITGIPVIEMTGCNAYSITLNVSRFSPGLYIARIYFSDGEIVTRRFVKKQ
jgi:hypothetical protein